jgi:hypothetical protein
MLTTVLFLETDMIQMVTILERKYNHSFPTSTEVKIAWSYTSTAACLHGVTLN